MKLLALLILLSPPVMAESELLIAVVPYSSAKSINTSLAESDVFGYANLVPKGSPKGTTPTHSWCTWRVSPNKLQTILNVSSTHPQFDMKMFDGDKITSEEILESLGLEKARPSGPDLPGL